MTRLESLTRGNAPASFEPAPGVQIVLLATGATSARGLTTALARFAPGTRLPYHTHPYSEVVVVLEGPALALVEGRRYQLGTHDALHIPAGVAHSLGGAGADGPALLHSSFPSAEPTREFVPDRFAMVDREAPGADCPENIVRFEQAPVYELSERAYFRDLFARRLGSRGICGGYGLFEPGASLPCHYHGFDESITIVSGTATCLVAGKQYQLAGCDTACIPEGRPHRFLNRSDNPMAMIWVYAGDEPDRVLVEPEFCDGTVPWPAP